MMFQETQRFREFAAPPAFVLDGSTEADVAKALIESKQQTEPFYIFDMDEAYRHIQRFKQSIPRAQVFFAMKANHSEMMLKLAIAMGVGFDCASPGEINKILNFGVDPTSIIYAVPNKTPEQMIYARISGVKHTTFNTACELYKIKQYWPDAKLLIRIKVESESVYKLGEKFGCLFETEAVGLLETAAGLGLTVIGVAFHVGSGCSSIESYAVGIRHARALFDHEAKAGRHMKILDIGGGFYREESNKFDQVSKLITDTLAQLFPDPSVQVIAEPGRYLCEAAFSLYCSINKVQTVMRNNKPLNKVYMNDGHNGTFRYLETWQSVYKFNDTRRSKEDLEDTILYGPSPDSKDYLEVKLPRCTDQDWLVFDMQGSYTLVFSGRFAGYEIPLIRPIISKKIWAQIKDRAIFSASDFIVYPDLAEPLPSTLPPLPPYPGRSEYPHLVLAD
ncbi:unnamed protein product [Chrysodeixis includens]|uniref:ornithine decarboxylase n=1 Tax=Chrysodeixis includens TaxID=689277 RepID=A0A9P0C3N5_CHRIL|nr:unnamed protein product [Chrysodeixis includens]